MKYDGRFDTPTSGAALPTRGGTGYEPGKTGYNPPGVEPYQSQAPPVGSGAINNPIGKSRTNEPYQPGGTSR